MKNYFFITIICLFIFTSSSLSRTLEEIKSSKELRVCPITSGSTFQIKPKGCKENCTYSGYRYDLLNAFLKTFDNTIKTKIILIPKWNTQFYNKDGLVIKEKSYTPELLASEKCDFYLATITELPWRTNKIDIVSYLPSRMLVVVRKGDKNNYKNINDLAGKKFTTFKGSSFEEWALSKNKKVFKHNPIKINTSAEGGKGSLEFLANNKGDFTLIDPGWGIRYLREEFIDLKIAFPVGKIQKMGWGFNKQDKDLQEKVKKFFKDETIDKNSNLNKIWEKYYGTSLLNYINMISHL